MSRESDSYVNMELYKLINKYNLNITHFSEAVGRSHAWVANCRRQGVLRETIEPLAEEMIRRGRLLVKINLLVEDLREVLRENGVKLAWLSRRMKMSRQGLYQALDYGLSDFRRKQAEAILKEVGHGLIETGRRLKHGDCMN